MANVDADGEPFDGAKTYQLRLPKDIPAAAVLRSLTVYDNQTRWMSANSRSATLSPCSQMFLSPAAEQYATEPVK